MKKSQPNISATFDISPWPSGEGFQGGQSWWEYVLSQDEDTRLEHLLMAALLNSNLRQRLLNHDSNLLDTFNFSETTQDLLKNICATTLEEFTFNLVDGLKETQVSVAPSVK